IGATGSQVFTIRTERQAANFFLMLPQDIEGLAGFGVPNVNGTVRVGTSQQTAVGTESHGGDLIAVTVQENNRLESLCVPNTGRRVPAPGDEAMDLWVPGQCLDAVGVTLEGAGQAARFHVPKANDAIFAG